MLRQLSQHVIGTIGMLLAVSFVHLAVWGLDPEEPIRSIILIADQVVAAAIVLHLFAHFLAYLWKSLQVPCLRLFLTPFG
jgi:hypothetical protein